MTFVWRDPWIPDEQPRVPRYSGIYRDPLLLVARLIDPISKEWQLDKLVDLFEVDDIHLILSIRPSRTNRPDGYCWSFTKSGMYSVRSGYQLALQLKDLLNPQYVGQPSTDAIKSKIWTVKASKKLKHFAWNSVAGCVLVRQRLAERHCVSDRTCPRCGNAEETINHMIFECPPALQIWTLSDIPTNPELFLRPSLFYDFDYLLWRAREMGASEKCLEVFP